MTGQLFPTDRPIPDFAQEETVPTAATGYPVGRTERGRAAPALSSCRSCKAPMLWVTFPSGRRNPLDPTPSEHGNIVIYERECDGQVWRIALLIPNEDLLAEARQLGIPLYVTHFQTCPDADEHRKEQARAAARVSG